jgi:hypothetical protein
MRVSRLALLLLGIVIGGVGTLLLDPHLGTRRRALVRDKARRYRRLAPRRVRGAARAAQGPVRGAVHTVAHRTPWYQQPAPPDLDEFVKHRVESVLGRRRDLSLADLNFDAADGVVHVRGTVQDEDTARRIVQAAASVEGVRAVCSLMHTPDGRAIDCEAGDSAALHGRPRAAIHGESVRRRLLDHWPDLTEEDVRASGGHPDRLAARIAARTGQSAREIRPALDQALMAPV